MMKISSTAKNHCQLWIVLSKRASAGEDKATIVKDVFGNACITALETAGDFGGRAAATAGGGAFGKD